MAAKLEAPEEPTVVQALEKEVLLERIVVPAQAGSEPVELIAELADCSWEVACLLAGRVEVGPRWSK